MSASWLPKVRILVGTAMLGTIASASSCLDNKPTEPSASLDCNKGYYEVNGQCVLRPDVVTLDIAHHANVTTSENCPWFRSSPSSVTVNQGFRFQNLTSTTYTIMMRRNQQGATATPLTTVAGGQTSSVFSLSDPGERNYYAASCVTAGSTPGVLYVTAGS